MKKLSAYSPIKMGLFILVLFTTTLAQDSDTLNIPRLEREIGQMIMVGIRGTHLNSDAMEQTRRQITQGEIGGIIFFKHNIKNSRQFRIFVESISRLEAPLPLFLAVDEEGGRVRRLKKAQGFVEFPSAASIGSKMDTVVARDTYRGMAEQIANSGLNCNLAPVVDVNVNRVSPAIGQLNRSFSRKPETVVEFANIFIQEHRKRGVLTTLKHYPGHGSSREDTHNDLTDITYTWRDSEKIPFQTLIDSSMVDMIMAGHLYDKKKDKRYPASLSHAHIQETLRDELGYKGVVSDDMQMGAIIKRYKLEEIVLAAVRSGSDIIQFSDPLDLDPDLPATIRAIIIGAIRDGRLEAQAVHDAYERIHSLKQKL